jgi:hypothetical protein
MRSYNRDYQNLVGGALLVVFGAALSVYSITHYRLGQVNHMGPGMYPTYIGAILAVLGLLIVVSGFGKGGGTFPSLELRPSLCCFAGIAAFTLLVDSFGLVPAICALTFISVQSDRKLGLPGTIALAAALSIMSVLIFKVGLEVPMNIWNWPF